MQRSVFKTSTVHSHVGAYPEAECNGATCDVNADCSVTQQCVCNAGYTGNGLTCQPGTGIRYTSVKSTHCIIEGLAGNVHALLRENGRGTTTGPMLHSVRHPGVRWERDVHGAQRVYVQHGVHGRRNPRQVLPGYACFSMPAQQNRELYAEDKETLSGGVSSDTHQKCPSHVHCLYRRSMHAHPK
jgi:hypothetical protein